MTESDARLQVAVVGGGHGAYAATADLAERGHRVRLWCRDPRQAQLLAERGAIGLLDHRGGRDVPVDLVSTELAVVVEDAELILVPLPSTAHHEVAAALVPHLRDGQVVLVAPGSLGAYVFARALHTARRPASVIFAEGSTLPYIARKRSATAVTIATRATRVSTGFFPSAKAAGALQVVRAAYPCVEPVSDILDAALINLGPIIHVPLVLLNAGAIEANLDWDVLRQGGQPSVRAVQYALDAERIAVRDALGYRPPHFALSSHYANTGEDRMYGNLAHERPPEPPRPERIDLRRHRFVTEDLVDGLTLLLSVANRTGCSTPVGTALHTLAARMLDVDMLKRGRTLERLGLSGYDAAALKLHLRNGIP